MCSKTVSILHNKKWGQQMENGSEINVVEDGSRLEDVKEEREEKVKEEEDEEELSVERIFESKEVPSWSKQLSMRAFAVSFLLSVMFCYIVMKFDLTTGIIPSLNISAALLGFFFVKTWTKVMTKSGMLSHPFTRQENTVIQTCVVASSGIAFSGMILILFPDRNVCMHKKHH